MAQLPGLVKAGNTVIVAAGTPAEVGASAQSRTAPYLRRFLDDAALARACRMATAKGRPPVHA